MLILAALSITSYLAWVSLRGGADALFGCGGLPYFDCEHVLGSRWSYWLGVPVSLAAAIVYTAMFAASWLIGLRPVPRVRRAGWAVLMLSAVLVAGAALWFGGLLVFVVRQLCIYCVVAHACGLVVALLVFIWTPIQRKDRSTRQWLRALGSLSDARRQSEPRPGDPSKIPAAGAWWVAGIGACGWAALVVGQVCFPPPSYRIEEFEHVATAGPVSPSDIGSPSSKAEDPVDIVPADPQVQQNSLKPTTRSAASDVAPATAPTALTEPPAPPPKPRYLVEFAEAPHVSPMEPQAGRRRVSMLGGRVSLTVGEFPLLGEPQAKYVAAEMLDYTCRHCRKLQVLLAEARGRYGESFALFILPVPMNTRCNKFVEHTHEDHKEACEYARLAMAVWILDSSKYEEFHDWLLEPVRPPALSEANAYAGRLVGSKALAEEITSPAVKRALQRSTAVFDTAGGGSVPKLLFGRYAMSFRDPKAEELFDLLERYMHISPALSRTAPAITHPATLSAAGRQWAVGLEGRCQPSVSSCRW